MLDYKIAKLSDQVYEIQNFITEEELDQVMQLAKTFNDSDWNQEGVQYDFWKDKNLSLKIVFNNKIFKSFHEKASNLFTGKPNITGINFQRYIKGDALGPHTDDHEGHRANSQIVYCGLVLYYNDDYEGGELEYPDLNIVHKPKSRSLVIHSGNILHGTLPVKNDVTRYISTMFVKHQIGEEVFLNEKVFKDIK